MIWHILHKDLRRLRLPAALTTALLAALTLLDIWRYDFEPGLAETVLNIVLPLAWGALIALAVQLEPLTSDTAFWLTRPYRRHTLAASKLLFAVLIVHLPLLIAHAITLAAHGFWPFGSELLWKQVLVLFAVTLPALAIACVTSTPAGFGWCALAAGALALLLNTALVGRRYPSTQSDWMPGALALVVVAAGGLSIIAVQYARRTRMFARATGAAVAVAAVLTYSFVPRDMTAAMQCSLEPKPSSALSLEFEPNGRVLKGPVWFPPDRTPLSIPVKVGGVENAAWILAEPISVRVSVPDGRLWQTRRDLRPDRHAFFSFDPEERLASLHLLPERNFVAAVAGAAVQVHGRMTIQPLRQTAAVVLPPVFGQTDVAGVGRCSGSVNVAMFGREVLKIVCESTDELPPVTLVILEDPESGREWRQRLGDSGNFHMIPSLSWLSPLERRQTFLQIVDNASNIAGDRWLVPRGVLMRSRIRIQPAVRDGCANVAYSFELADVRKWVIQPNSR